jgi:phosphate-selective porin OprO and OprP
MRRWYRAATLTALGLLGAGGPTAQAQTVGRPAVDVGPTSPPPGTFVAAPTRAPQVVPPPPALAPTAAPAPAGLPGVLVSAPAAPALVLPTQATSAPALPAPASPMPAAVLPPPAATIAAPAFPAQVFLGTGADAPMPGATVGSSPTLPAPKAAPGGPPSPSSSGTPSPGGPSVTQPADPNAPTFTAGWNNGLNFWAPNKDWVVHVGGRFQYETVLWDEPRRLKTSAVGNGGIPGATATSGTGVGSLDDGMFFRRVRLKGDGTAYGVVEFNIEVDFEQLNFITYDHMWAGFKDVPVLGTVRVGQQKVPQGLDSMSSDYHLMFLERNLVSEAIYQDLFAPGLLIANDYDKLVTWQTMFHRSQAVVGFFNEDFGDGDYAWTSRATVCPVYANDGEEVLHLGGSFQWRHADLGRTIQPGGTGDKYADTQHDVRFRSRPEMRDATGIGSTEILGGNTARFVDTGFLLASDVCTYGSELLWIEGPFSIQGEAGCARVQDARSIYPKAEFGRFRGDPVFWGASVQTSYFLTGEHRGYDRRFGVFDRPKVANNFNPKNCADGGADCAECANPGWGAWEIAYRYSYLDLNDNGILGGLLSEHTIGVNWYFNDNFKVQLNYINIHRSVVPPARSGTVNGVGTLVQFYF